MNIIKGLKQTNLVENELKLYSNRFCVQLLLLIDALNHPALWQLC